MTIRRHHRLWHRALLAAALIAGAPSAAETIGDPPLYAERVDAFRGLSQGAKVALLVDREEIRDLVSTYALRAAQGVSMADLFIDEGAFINKVPDTPIMEIRGREALDQFFGNMGKDGSRAMPMIHNHLISVNGDEATGFCSIEVRTAANGVSMTGSGYYRDRYRRENGRWKFVEREATFFHFVPQQPGWAKPVEAP
jgi:hypothetical protein